MRTILLAFIALLICSLPSRAQEGDGMLSPCDAAFSVTVDPGDPMTIHLQDESSGQIAYWQWSFGDGATSEEQDPVHTYASGGTYFVCLTVSDDDTVNPCHDVMCLAVTIHEPGACIADYSYAIDPADPLKVQFHDQSGGNIDSWHWDFGDGSTSGDPNPEHIFPAFGKFRVCLDAYNADSVSECNDIKCDSLAILPPPACQAGFTGQLDTLNHATNTFIFTNLSTGDPNLFTWRFDDGATYHTRDVVHRFSSQGIHSVCLVAAREAHGEILCADSVCKDFETAVYYNLGGHLFAGELPINNPVSTGDTGVAYVFRIGDRGLMPFDTCRFTELGYFAFPLLLNGEYLVRAMLTPGSSNYAGYFPGYFNASAAWTTADTVRLSGSNYVADIVLAPTATPPPGEGTITGKVLEILTGSTGTDVGNAEVILYDGQVKPLQFVFSGKDGTFGFTNLPYGAYHLAVEYPGRYSRLIPVWLDASDPVIDSLDLELFDHDVTGTTDVQNGMTGLFIFPNPATSAVNVSVNLDRTTTVNFTVWTLTGSRAAGLSSRCAAGPNLITLPLPGLSPGLYLLVIRSDDGSFHAVKKLVTY